MDFKPARPGIPGSDDAEVRKNNKFLLEFWGDFTIYMDGVPGVSFWRSCWGLG